MKYDVFISCKSEDYDDAEVIYNFLVSNGFKTFLATKELRALGDSEYREEITKAIETVYLMIVFASSSENIMSKWVKYEWGMFIDGILDGTKEGQLVTILKGVEVKELRIDLKKYQSFTLDNFKNDILSYIVSAAELLYRQGEKDYEAGIYKSAVEYYLQSAEQGYAKAQYKMGLCYYNGEGVEQSDAEAVKWFRLAADKGLSEAQVSLAYCLKKGYGVERNFTEAFEWYRMAAAQENSDAERYLGYCYYIGKEHVHQDYAEAIKWFRRATDHGDSYAPYFLGRCYWNGEGVERSELDGKKWLRMAAQRGNMDAKKMLIERKWFNNNLE
jgi:hypothetical protein